MDIVKMMWALVYQGNHRVLDALEVGFWLMWARYIDGATVTVRRTTREELNK